MTALCPKERLQSLFPWWPVTWLSSAEFHRTSARHSHDTLQSPTPSHLVEVRVGLRLPHALKVFHVDELEVVEQARVGCAELWQELHVWQVPEVFVTPVVEVTQAVPRQRPRTD